MGQASQDDMGTELYGPGQPGLADEAGGIEHTTTTTNVYATSKRSVNTTKCKVM